MPQGSPLTFKEICMEIYWYLNKPVVTKKSGKQRSARAARAREHGQAAASVDRLIASMQRDTPASRSSATGTESDKKPFVLEGELRYAVRTVCSIQGEEFIVSPRTWVVGNMEEGSHARVKGVIKKGERHATNIVIGKVSQGTLEEPAAYAPEIVLRHRS